MKNGSFVFFGPVNVGKSTMIGYLYGSSLNKDRYEKEVAKIKYVTGENFRSDRFYSYFVDTAKDEYTKQTENENTFGTSKKMHLARYGDFDLIDTPGGADYARQQYKGLSMASIGVFAIEIGQLIEDQGANTAIRSFKKFNDFFSTWFIWKKMHGIRNTIIMLTKYDIYQGKEYFDKAVSYLKNIIGEDIDQTIIVPTGIETEKNDDINVLKKMDAPWYKGMCLLDAFKEKCRSIENSDDELNSLLMIHNEYKTTYSTTTKSRWKILKGKLCVNDKIKIAPIKLKDKKESLGVTVREIEYGESRKKEAYAGEIVNVGLGICDGWDGATPQIAIATSENDEIYLGNIINITVNNSNFITNKEWLRLTRLREKQQMSLIWFSDIVQVEIVKISVQEQQIGFELLLLSEDAVAFPAKMLPQTVIVKLPVNVYHEQSFTIRGLVTSISQSAQL